MVYAYALNGYKVSEIWWQISPADAIPTVRLHSETEPEFRRQGLFRRLFFELLKEHPEIKRRSATLTETNFDVFEEGIGAGLSPTAALLKTPALRVTSDLGFTRLISFSVNKEARQIELLIEKP